LAPVKPKSSVETFPHSFNPQSSTSINHPQSSPQATYSTMAGFFKDAFDNIVGGVQTAVKATPSSVDDFADFVAAAAKPVVQSAASIATPATPNAAGTIPTFGAANFLGASTPVYRGPYTKWYRIWERHTWQDFITEYIILTFVVVVVIVHFIGATRNRNIAKKWFKRVANVLKDEYALVGFGTQAREYTETEEPEYDALREVSTNEFTSYVSGRENVAYIDINLFLLRRINPLIIIGEYITALFIETMVTPKERAIYTITPFDGDEKELAVEVTGPVKKSTYDNFVFAIVKKDIMQYLRETCYDLSLAVTKDHAKLPPWAAVLSESAEITDTLLTNDLVKAITLAGDQFEFLKVTDQPEDKPRT
jgi:hypothetical protein